MNATAPAAPIKVPVSLRILRVTTRVWSLLSLGVVLMFALGERMNLARFTPVELQLFLCFPLGVMLGMALGWRREFWGGVLSVVSLAAFYGVDWWHSHHLPRGLAFMVLCAPGFLFLLCGWRGRLAKANARQHDPKSSI